MIDHELPLSEWEKMKEFSNRALHRELHKWLLNPAGLDKKS